jgi:hypothetical protein
MKRYNKFGFFIPLSTNNNNVTYVNGPQTKSGLILGIVTLTCFAIGGYYITTKTGTSNTNTIFTVTSVTPIIQQTNNSVGIAFKIMGTTPICGNVPVTLINYNYIATVGEKISVWTTPECTTTVQTTSSATIMKKSGYFIMIVCIIVIIFNLKSLI